MFILTWSTQGLELLPASCILSSLWARRRKALPSASPVPRQRRCLGLPPLWDPRCVKGTSAAAGDLWLEIWARCKHLRAFEGGLRQARKQPEVESRSPFQSASAAMVLSDLPQVRPFNLLLPFKGRGGLWGRCAGLFRFRASNRALQEANGLYKATEGAYCDAFVAPAHTCASLKC